MNLRPAYFHCALCGFEFEKAGATCATSCLLARHCKLVRCPNCGYEFPEPSPAPGWLQKLLGRRNGEAVPAAARELISLDEGSEGATYELVCLDGSHESRRTALAVYGLVPGCRLSLASKRPSYVVRVGETELAFEGSIARQIFVKPVQA